MPFLHGKGAEVYIAGYDVSAYLNKADIDGTADIAEVTAFQANSKAFIPGLTDAKFTAEGFFDGAAEAVDETLRTILNVGASGGPVVTLLPGGDAFGNAGVCLQAIETAYKIGAEIGDAVKVSMEAQANQSGLEPVLVLQALAALTTTGNGSNIDNGALTTAGGSGYVHVANISGTGGPTCTVKIQHSVDNSAWVDLLTFTAVTAEHKSERLTVPVGTTINRHLRATRTIGGTTPSFEVFAAFNRK